MIKRTLRLIYFVFVGIIFFILYAPIGFAFAIIYSAFDYVVNGNEDAATEALDKVFDNKFFNKVMLVQE